MKILLFASILLILSCAKSENTDATVNSQSTGCDGVTKAVVKKEMLNVAGTEYFYYLEVPWTIKNSTKVYPSFLTPSLQIEDQKVEIHYNATEEQYSYIPCTAAHPVGLIEEHMPLVTLCSVVATN